MSDEMNTFLGRSAGGEKGADGKEWSEQQRAVFDAVACGSGNVFVEALAGAGKTTTVLEVARRFRGRAAMVAFNKSIAEELKRCAPRGLEVKTFHAIGYGILKQHDRNCVIDPDKGINIAREIVGPSAPAKFAAAVKRAASMLKSYLVEDPDRAVEVLDDHDIGAIPFATQRELYFVEGARTNEQ